MYFPFLELQKWRKRFAEIRRRNCAVLPQFFCVYFARVPKLTEVSPCWLVPNS